jgi:hypothetical protein
VRLARSHEEGAMARRGAGHRELTERNRFWLRHLERQAAGTETSKAYAAREKLSICALYQARMRLVAQGALRAAPARKDSRPETATAVGFTRVALPAPAPAAVACRLRLSSGMVLEWSAPPPVEVLVDLVARMASPR